MERDTPPRGKPKKDPGPLVDELRRMLSDLNEPDATERTDVGISAAAGFGAVEPPADEDPASNPSVDSPNGSFDAPRMGDFGALNGSSYDSGEAAFDPPPAEVDPFGERETGQAQPDDKDFWSGNVLGWSPQAAGKTPTEPTLPKSDDDGNEWAADPSAESIFSSPPAEIAPAPSPSEPPTAAARTENANPSPSAPTEDPFAEPAAEADAPSWPENLRANPPEAPAEEMIGGRESDAEEPAKSEVDETARPDAGPETIDPPLPSEETPPLRDVVEDLRMSFPKDPEMKSDARNAESVFGDQENVGHVFGAAGEASADAPSPSEPSEREVSLPPTVGEAPAPPIPGTKEKREPGDVYGDDGGGGADMPMMRPGNVVQLACFFPEGRDDDAKNFLTRLSELGGRARVPLKLESVFMQKWNGGSIDFAGWTRSTSLAGADFQIVLADRESKELFSDKIAESQSGSWAGRVVFMDQLALRSLYADLLIQLGRQQ